MNLKTDLAVQSFCFRYFRENTRVAELVRECGLTKLELCAVHIDFGDESSFDSVIETYKQAGIQIVSIGVQGANAEKEKERLYFEFAKRAGAKHISVHFNVNSFPECYRVSEQLAEEYDMHIGVHNHGGYHWLGNSEMLSRVFRDTNDRIGLCLDTAWALDAKQEPIQMAQRFADRWYGTHIKDFVFDRARKPEDVIVGEGNLNLPALVKLVEESATLQFCALEYEGDIENPVPPLLKCVEAVHNAL